MQKITVLVLARDGYAKTVYTVDEVITSSLFPDLNVTANAIWS